MRKSAPGTVCPGRFLLLWLDILLQRSGFLLFAKNHLAKWTFFFARPKKNQERPPKGECRFGRVRMDVIPPLETPSARPNFLWGEEVQCSLGSDVRFMVGHIYISVRPVFRIHRDN